MKDSDLREERKAAEKARQEAEKAARRAAEEARKARFRKGNGSIRHRIR